MLVFFFVSLSIYESVFHGEDYYVNDIVILFVGGEERQGINKMVGLDDNFNGISDDCFDDMFKFFDFPLEDVEGNVGGEDWSTKFLWLEPPPLDVLAGLPSGFSDKNSVDSSKFPGSFSTQVSSLICYCCFKYVIYACNIDCYMIYNTILLFF